MMRLLGYLGAWTVLALAAAWVALDYVAGDLVRRAMTDASAEGLVRFEEAHLRLPGTARFAPVTITDPDTGLAVIELDEVHARMEPAREPDGWTIRPSSVRGTGGRVVLSGLGADAPLISAIDALGDMFERLRGDRARSPLPSMEFRDVTVVVRADGLPDQVVAGATVWVEEHDGMVRIDVRPGTPDASVQISFPAEGGGPWEGRAVAVRMQPALLAVLGPVCGEMARMFRPTGLVDADVRVGRDESVVSSGRLSDATLAPAAVPFPLEHVDLPFDYRDGRFRVRQAEVRVMGGTMLTDVDSTPERLEVRADVERARFERRLVDLVPALQDVPWLQFDDGGSVELHLAWTDEHDGAPPRITGWGGLHVDRLWFGEGIGGGALARYGQLRLDDVLGRFELDDNLLRFHETSARCASGIVTLQGTIDLLTNALDFQTTLRDMDLVRLEEMLSPTTADGSDLRGWLEGRLDFTSIAGAPTTTRATGRLSIRAGNLWRLPVIGAVVSALEPGGRRPGERQGLQLDFRIKSTELKIDELRLESPFLSLYSDRGEIDFDRDLALDILITPLRVPLPILGDVVQYIERKLLEVRVEGTLLEPKVTVMPVEVVTGPLTRFVGWVGRLFGIGG